MYQIYVSMFVGSGEITRYAVPLCYINISEIAKLAATLRIRAIRLEFLTVRLSASV